MFRGFHAAAAAAGFGGGVSVRAASLPQNSSMDCEFAQVSDVGRVRQGNEDYLGHFAPATPDEVRERGYLFALADGVGGHDRGEVASRTAIETVLADFRESGPGEPHGPLLTRMIRHANTNVLDAGHAAKSSGAGMATTIVACALRYDRAAVAHVGDSRCYLIRRGIPNLLTRDHTIANEHLRLKLISKEDAAQAETRHMLSRSLGAELMVNVEINEHQVFAGDVLLLCSDGLHGSVEATEMAALTSHGGDLGAAAKRLVEIANQRDGSDNISLQLIRVKSVERVGMYRGRPYRLP
jgi:serine/threonine protein phosphatase PrpC